MLDGVHVDKAMGRREPFFGYEKHRYTFGTWPDDGTAYDTRGLCKALDLPDPVELIRRESTVTKSSDYSPDWRSLKDAFDRLVKSLELALSHSPELLAVELAETPGIVYAEHPIKSGADAIALHADVADKNQGGFINKHGHFHLSRPLKVRSLIRGVTRNQQGVWVPCTYVVYEGDAKRHVDAVKICSMTCQNVIETYPDRYTFRIVRS